MLMTQSNRNMVLQKSAVNIQSDPRPKWNKDTSYSFSWKLRWVNRLQKGGSFGEVHVGIPSSLPCSVWSSHQWFEHLFSSICSTQLSFLYFLIIISLGHPCITCIHMYHVTVKSLVNIMAFATSTTGFYNDFGGKPQWLTHGVRSALSPLPTLLSKCRQRKDKVVLPEHLKVPLEIVHADLTEMRKNGDGH